MLSFYCVTVYLCCTYGYGPAFGPHLDMHELTRPSNMSTVGSRAFPVATAQAWNGLLETVVL